MPVIAAGGEMGVMHKGCNLFSELKTNHLVNPNTKLPQVYKTETSRQHTLTSPQFFETIFEALLWWNNLKWASSQIWEGRERDLGTCGAHIKTILERSTIDDLNLHYFISLFAAWNAIDTFFVFVIVLISHPAWAPGSACARALWSPAGQGACHHETSWQAPCLYFCHFSSLSPLSACSCFAFSKGRGACTNISRGLFH